MFNLSVIKLNLHRSDRLSPEAFLRLFFLEDPAAPRSAAHRNSQETTSTAGKAGPGFKRSSTYPLSVVSGRSERGESVDDESHTIFSPASPATQASTLSEDYGYHRSLVRTQADPVLHGTQDEHQDLSINPFPQVLAVSGLEDCSEQVQRALWTSMSTGKIPVGEEVEMPSIVRALPDDFFVVYVCPYGDPCSRPPIHRSLVSAIHRASSLLQKALTHSSWIDLP